MPDDKVTVMPIGQRASWARTPTEFDPPQGDNMQGKSVSPQRPIASATVKNACDRVDRAVDSFIEAIGLLSHLAEQTSSDVDREMMTKTVEQCAERFDAAVKRG